MKFFRRSGVESISKIWLLAIYFCLKRTPEYSRPNIKHWKMLECDDPAPTVFDKTAYIKYHFSCTVKSSTKNTRETKSTIVQGKLAKLRLNPDFDCQKNVLFVILVMSTTYLQRKMVSGMCIVSSQLQTLHRNWPAQTGEKCRITGLVGASSQKVGCQSPQFFVKRRVHCCLFTFKLFKFCWLLHRIQDSEQIHVLQGTNCSPKKQNNF